jgi:hypothetical protein
VPSRTAGCFSANTIPGSTLWLSGAIYGKGKIRASSRWRFRNAAKGRVGVCQGHECAPTPRANCGGKGFQSERSTWKIIRRPLGGWACWASLESHQGYQAGLNRRGRLLSVAQRRLLVASEESRRSVKGAAGRAKTRRTFAFVRRPCCRHGAINGGGGGGTTYKAARKDSECVVPGMSWPLTPLKALGSVARVIGRWPLRRSSMRRTTA